ALAIYPVADYANVNADDNTRIEALKALLKTHTLPVNQMYPVLPIITAAQVFHSNEKYLTLQNGSGVRYLTEYEPDVSPIASPEIRYVFIGLTDDEKYYMHFIAQIDPKVLPKVVPPEILDFTIKNYDETKYDAYVNETTALLNAA